MSGVVKVFYNIIRGFTRLFSFIILFLGVKIIKTITYEPGKKKEITVRKAKRIRLLSKVKNFVINSLPQSIISFLGWETYKDYFNKHLRNGLQLR